MAFGVRASEEPVNESKNTNNSWIKWFGKGDTTIHFLNEIDDWYVYWEHFSQTASRGYPCTRDRKTCPGCTSSNEKEAKAAKRYLVNALKEGYIDLYKIPASIKDELNRFAERDGGSIMRRDYTIVRFEKDGGTKYSVDREDRNVIPEELYAGKLHDFEEALEAAFNEVWGPQDEQPDPSEPKSKPSLAQRTEEIRSRSQERRLAAQTEHTNVHNVPEDDDPPFEPAAQEAADQVITEDELRRMTLEQIRFVYQMAGLPLPDTEDVNALADQLVKELS